MIKDLFVDNNIAKNFKNPADPEYERLIKWLFEKGHLVLTQKLLKEYHDSNRGNYGQSILSIIARLTKEERIVMISNEQLEILRFSKTIDKKCLKLNKDYWHLKAILLSNRKMAVIIDKAFRDAVNCHPKHEGIQACAVARPEEIDYEN
ncbi:MAG: hypothetical protein LH609_23775 [Rudanella sp.]|nr:hypothetical protein [Rudanella sp.]